jgi:hypothetical protein
MWLGSEADPYDVQCRSSTSEAEDGIVEAVHTSLLVNPEAFRLPPREALGRHAQANPRRAGEGIHVDADSSKPPLSRRMAALAGSLLRANPAPRVRTLNQPSANTGD